MTSTASVGQFVVARRVAQVTQRPAEAVPVRTVDAGKEPAEAVPLRTVDASKVTKAPTAVTANTAAGIGRHRWNINENRGNTLEHQ